MKEITVEFTNGDTSTWRGDVIIDPNVSIIIHDEFDDLNVGINWNHIYYYSIESDIEE